MDLNSVSNSAQQSIPVEKPKSGKKWKIVLIIVGVVIGLIVIGALFTASPNEPAKVALFYVRGDPSVDEVYTVFLALQDENSA